MKEILIKLESVYIRESERSALRGNCVGLCYIALNNLEVKEFKKFRKYLERYVKNKKQIIFYDSEDEETTDTHSFIWKSRDPKPRLEWLKEHINLN